MTPGHPIAFSSPGAVYRYFNGELPLSQIEDALRGVHAYAAHREYKQPRVYNPFYAYRRRTRFQADLIEMLPLKNANRGYGYLLVIIDVFSRKVWVIPLKKKDRFNTERALRAWLMSLDEDDDAWTDDGINRRHRQRYIFTDRGKEFLNGPVKQLMKEFNVQMDTSKRGLNKAALAERVNKTLQIKIYKRLKHTGRNNFIDTLPETVDTYNNGKHRTLKYSTPNEADKKINEERIRAIHSERYAKVWQKSKRTRDRRKLRRGDMCLVRVAARGKVDQRNRAYTPNFGDEFFVVTAVRKRMPVPMYKVRSLLTGQTAPGSFYSNELTKVKPKTFKAKRYVQTRVDSSTGLRWRKVRFEGLHPVFDSWVKEEDIDRNHHIQRGKLNLLPTLSNLDSQ